MYKNKKILMFYLFIKLGKMDKQAACLGICHSRNQLQRPSLDGRFKGTDASSPSGK